MKVNPAGGRCDLNRDLYQVVCLTRRRLDCARPSRRECERRGCFVGIQGDGERGQFGIERRRQDAPDTTGRNRALQVRRRRALFVDKLEGQLRRGAGGQAPREARGGYRPRPSTRRTTFAALVLVLVLEAGCGSAGGSKLSRANGWKRCACWFSCSRARRNVHCHQRHFGQVQPDSERAIEPCGAFGAASQSVSQAGHGHAGLARSGIVPGSGVAI